MTDNLLPEDGGLRDLEAEIDTVQTTSFEDLTLAEALGQLWRAPLATVGALVAVAAEADRAPTFTRPVKAGQPAEISAVGIVWVLATNTLILLHGLAVLLGLVVTLRALAAGDLPTLVLMSAVGVSVTVTTLVVLKMIVHDRFDAQVTEALRLPLAPSLRSRLRLIVYVLAFAATVHGGFILVSGEIRTESDQLDRGAVFLLAAVISWAYAEIAFRWPGRFGWFQRAQDAPSGIDFSLSRWRLIALGMAVILAALTWDGAGGNQFGMGGLRLGPLEIPLLHSLLTWPLSVLMIVVVFAPESWSPGRVWARLSAWNARRVQRRRESAGSFSINWTLIAFVLIMIVAAAFRFYDLDAVPQQMTSDHKEKLLDAQRVLEGDRDIFFANNGGREGFQMYAMAFMAQLPGLGMDHVTLKLLAVIESLITLPALFWLGLQVGGEKNRRLGVTLGLVLMALVAVSYWHLAVTRLALRIILTPLVMALLLGFLIRGMRHNRRADFIAAGLVLGFGLYTYQAVRMMPLLVLVAVALAIFTHRRRWRTVLAYLVNLTVLVVISFVIFVPLLRYSSEFPEDFWRRSIGRIFGEEFDAQGRPIDPDLSVTDRAEAFFNNLPELQSNIRNALLMFNWKGDVGWINGVPNEPSLDPYVGGLLLLGVVACGVLMVRTRDPVYVLIPLSVLVMLLPSALAIGRGIENPSATRASGALPPVYLLAALALVLLALAFRRAVNSTFFRRGVVVALVAGVTFASLLYNWRTYYDEYRQIYRFETWPYSIPGDYLAGFVDSGGTFGNAYMIGWSNWWDYTIIGIEAGAMDWPNGIVNLLDVPTIMNDLAYCDNVPYPVDPESDFLFFYHFDDMETERQLIEWFPTGYGQRVETYADEYDFDVFRVPALGDARFREFVDEFALGRLCLPPVE